MFICRTCLIYVSIKRFYDFFFILKYLFTPVRLYFWCLLIQTICSRFHEAIGRNLLHPPPFWLYYSFFVAHFSYLKPNVITICRSTFVPTYKLQFRSKTYTCVRCCYNTENDFIHGKIYLKNRITIYITK